MIHHRGNSVNTKPSSPWRDADLIEMMTRRSPVRDSGGRMPPSSSRPRSANRGDRARERDRGDFEHEYPLDPDQLGQHHPRGEGRRLKKRSQSLGQRMTKAVTTTPRQREQAPAATLNLYHVSRPEPRARWVFNLSKHTNVVDHGPPPDTVTSTIDKMRPSLGGLVWVNATLGNHCCLQRGVKTKSVTPVPAEVLDGWLNGQTGFWWIGALKEGHRSVWDSHIVMSWAMVFIPSSPEVAARNNMEVWRDKCLKGSLRVARPGELYRKIIDIVTDDQDSEPESVVHTHLCILLAEGDDLELKRPKMFSSATPRDIEALRGFGSTGGGKIVHSKSMGAMDALAGAGGPVDLSQVTSLDGTPKLRNSLGDSDGDGETKSGGGGGTSNALVTQKTEDLEEALGKVGRYRERILILKQDRQAKKAMLAQLKEELREKEEEYKTENDRLRQERDEIKERAKVLWMDLENLRIEIESNAKNITEDEANSLRVQVERLRRERNEARSDAMRWLEEQQQSSLTLPAPSPSNFITASGSTTDVIAASDSSRGGPGFATRSHSARSLGTASGVPSTTTTISAAVAGSAPTTAVYANGAGGSSSGVGSGVAGGGGGGGVGAAPAAGGGVAPGAVVAGTGVVAVDYKAAIAIAKLKAKVERLRKERDEAEKQAASWLRNQQKKLGQPDSNSNNATGGSNSNSTAAAAAAAAAAMDPDSNTSHVRSRESSSAAAAGGPVVASLKAESLKLKKELHESREEAKRWRTKAAGSRGDSIGGGGVGLDGVGGGMEFGESSGVSGSSFPPSDDALLQDGKESDNTEEAGVQARRALGKLLGQALNLLDPQQQASGDTATSTTATPSTTTTNTNTDVALPNGVHDGSNHSGGGSGSDGDGDGISAGSAGSAVSAVSAPATATTEAGGGKVGVGAGAGAGVGARTTRGRSTEARGRAPPPPPPPAVDQGKRIVAQRVAQWSSGSGLNSNNDDEDDDDDNTTKTTSNAGASDDAGDSASTASNTPLTVQPVQPLAAGE